jgi:hypothetical protein
MPATQQRCPEKAPLSRSCHYPNDAPMPMHRHQCANIAVDSLSTHYPINPANADWRELSVMSTASAAAWLGNLHEILQNSAIFLIPDLLNSGIIIRIL